MRAIRLKLTAFGPYLQEQIVEFNDLGEESIFLITGPTGAGKTTIFDAICYALYGRASGSDREQDSLRSDFANADEQTEVQFVFSLHEQTYEVTRKPKQVRKKARGDGYTDEPAQATFYEIVDGEKLLVSSRITMINEIIQDKIGFDYDQFCKMVLIPQGEFRKLISENSREREAILQSIFNTYVYKKMTEELKSQAKQLEEEINSLDQLIHHEMIKIKWEHHQVDESDTVEKIVEKLQEEMFKIEQQIKLSSAEKGKQEERLEKAQNIYYLNQTFEQKFLEYEQLLQEQTALELQTPVIEVKQKQLQVAMKAQKVVPYEEQSNARKKEWQEQREKVKKQQEKVTTVTRDHDAKQRNYLNEFEKQADLEKLHEEIKQAKQQMEQIDHYLTLQQDAKKSHAKSETEHKQLTDLEENIKKCEQSIEEIDQELNKEQEVTITYFQTKDKFAKAQDTLNRLDNLMTEYKKLEKLRSQYVKIHKQYQEKAKALASLQKEYDRIDTKQKEQYAAYMAHQLESGDACPVCGSLEHPSKAVHQTELVNLAEFEKLKQELQDKQEEFITFEQVYNDSKSDGRSQRDIVNNLQQDLSEEIRVLDADTINEQRTTLQQNISHLDHKRKETSQLLDKMKEQKTVKSNLLSQREKLKQTFDQFSESYQTTKNEALQIKTRLADLAKQLPAEIHDTEAFKQQLIKQESNYMRRSQQWEDMKQAYQLSHEALQKETTILKALHSFTEEIKERFDDQLNYFSQFVKDSGFSSIEGYHQAKMSLGAQETIKNEVEKFDTRTKQLLFQIQQLKGQIKDQSRPNLAELQEDIKLQRDELQKQVDHLHTLRISQDTNKEINEQIKMNATKQTALKDEFYIVGDLADLAHGNNQLRLSFERYVLASFLDEILLQANIRLDRMTEYRYQLIRSGQVAKQGAQSGLDLEVLDHHTGQQRSVKTLSGGEGFKASLSLALGLADVVQAHAGGIQMDTLFIDEGFGTLDETSLQQAIDCLKDLQDSNRLLGIISHVPHLKDEIHAKLEITPSPRGSTLAFSFG